MVLAAFLGGIKGAADRYSARLEQTTENNKSLTERMVNGTNNYNTAITDKDLLYHMGPEMMLAAGKSPFSMSATDPEENSSYIQAIQNNEYLNGRPSFSVINTGNAIVNIGRLADLDTGFRFSELANREDALGEDVRRWESATVATLAEMVDDGSVKDLESGVAISRTPIHNKIPGWDNFTPQRKQYYNGLISKAFGLKLYQAEGMNLVEPTGLTTFVQEDDDGNLRKVPQKFPNIDGTFTSINDIPEEITTALAGVSKSRRDDASEYVANTIKSLHSMNQKKGLPHQEGAGVVQYLNSQFVNNRITENGGVLYSIPSDKELIKDNTRKVYNQVGMGDFIELTAASIPEKSLFKLVTSPPGGYENYKKTRKEAYEALVIGVEKSDQRKKFNTKTQDLRTLKSNIDDFFIVLENGAEIGVAGKLVLFTNGARAFMNSINNLFINDTDYATSFRNQEFQDVQSRLDVLTEKGEVTQIMTFLEKQLAYSIARALESSTGNARLSNIDVEMARSSIGLSNLLAAPQNAKAVLGLLLRRTERELEYQEALGSGRLRTMQAAQYVQDLYGADSMLRVGSVDNQAGAYASLRDSLEKEAQRTGVTLPETQARRATGRVDDGNQSN